MATLIYDPRWKNPKLEYKGYIYALTKAVNVVEYWRCHKKRCMGRLRKERDESVVTRGHNHCIPIVSSEKNILKPIETTDCKEEINNSDNLGNPQIEISSTPSTLVTSIVNDEPQQSKDENNLHITNKIEDNKISSSQPQPLMKKNTMENVIITKKIKFTTPKVVGLERGLEAKEVVGATNASGELMFLMKWHGTTQMDLIPARQANIKWPQIVLNFYEKRAGWTKKIKIEVV